MKKLTAEQADPLRKHPSLAGQIDLGRTGALVGRFTGQQKIGKDGNQRQQDKNQGGSSAQSFDRGLSAELQLSLHTVPLCFLCG